MKSRLTNEFALSKKLSVQTMDVHMCLLRKIGTSTWRYVTMYISSVLAAQPGTLGLMHTRINVETLCLIICIHQNVSARPP